MNANQRLAMKGLLWLFLVLATGSMPARAEDIVDMISRYRAEHGLPAVKTDPELTAIAERQAKVMAASGIMDHNVAGSFASRMSGVSARGGGREHRGRLQDLGRDVSGLAALARPQRQPSVAEGQQRRRCLRPQ